MLSFSSFAKESTTSSINYSSTVDNGKLIERYFEIKTKPMKVKYVQQFEQIGRYSTPFSTIREVTKVYGKVAYDSIYETDEFGMRFIPNSLYPKKPKTHLIMAGDSNTFGEGVSTENSMPVLLAKKISQSHPYNLGVRGGGPHNTLAFMEFFPWQEMIIEKNGIFIYNYYDFLMERVIGSRNIIEWSLGNDPYYDLNDRGEITNKGKFKDTILTKFFIAINKSIWLRKLLPVLPKPHHKHTVLLAKIFLKISKEYSKHFPEGKFYVAINYSYGAVIPNRLDELQIELIKNNVPYFVLPSTDFFKQEFSASDGHINAPGQQFSSDVLYKYLSKIKNSSLTK